MHRASSMRCQSSKVSTNRPSCARDRAPAAPRACSAACPRRSARSAPQLADRVPGLGSARRTASSRWERNQCGSLSSRCRPSHATSAPSSCSTRSHCTARVVLPYPAGAWMTSSWRPAPRAAPEQPTPLDDVADVRGRAEAGGRVHGTARRAVDVISDPVGLDPADAAPRAQHRRSAPAAALPERAGRPDLDPGSVGSAGATSFARHLRVCRSRRACASRRSAALWA